MRTHATQRIVHKTKFTARIKRRDRVKMQAVCRILTHSSRNRLHSNTRQNTTALMCISIDEKYTQLQWHNISTSAAAAAF